MQSSGKENKKDIQPTQPNTFLEKKQPDFNFPLSLKAISKNQIKSFSCFGVSYIKPDEISLFLNNFILFLLRNQTIHFSHAFATNCSTCQN